MLKKKRVGIIGCGSIAGFNELDTYREKPCTHVGAYKKRNDVFVVGCCDTRIKQSQMFAKEFEIPFFTSSIKKLLDKKLDILSVCVPYKYNYSVIKKITQSKNLPKKILLEKPISDKMVNAKRIVYLCKRKNIKLYVNNRQLSFFYKTFKFILEI